MHAQMQEWMARWRELHPGWVHKLWRDDSPTTITCGDERLQSHYPDLLNRACHHAQRSNIWRYELVLAQGGVYLDTDMEPLANIEAALAPYDAFTATQFLADSVSGACFGARPDHPWMREAVERLSLRDPTVHMAMGDSFATEMYRRHSNVVYRVPRELLVFYAHRDFKVSDGLATPATLAIHRWSFFWHPTGYVPLG